MNRLNRIATVIASLASMGAGYSADAQNLKEKMIGAWTLESGSENFTDGKKLLPWATGNLILDQTGHISVFLMGRDRPTTSPSTRTPVGPAVAYYGTYSVSEADSTVTIKIERSLSPSIDGVTRTQKVDFKGDTMTITGSEVKTPEGTMTPVNEWLKLK
jgi:hypothetical protein